MKFQLDRIINLVQNMGLRYVGFRVQHELLKKTGLLKRKFPTNPPLQHYISLDQWRAQQTQFFFADKNDLKFAGTKSEALETRYRELKSGNLMMFNSLSAHLGVDYDWVTNPDSGHKYDISKHWTEIADYSKEAGDIKYVWEKSRFSYIYDLIRYDHAFGVDCAELVFADIVSWIKGNPINCGPNYRCSQEMSLRVLNWTFALHYYKNSDLLTASVFAEIQHVIYWHLHHIYNNIDFSRIAVRNNHAITESLALYLGGLFYGGFPDAGNWKTKGKKWFEEEIAYQVYADGTFLQFSMNYHRVVVQLLTWGIVLSEKNGERFADVVYDRAMKSVKYLRTCMVDDNGWLPNYGANDGALFFRFSDAHYRDYRPQIQALARSIGMDADLVNTCEDLDWYGIDKTPTNKWQPLAGMHSFEKGGYYVIREQDTLTFIKCGGYKDRPSQADNLHVDVWHKGQNILTDAGSYKYNTDAETIRYFSGTRSHNTVMLDDCDQMLKGGRFIWYYWTQRKNASLSESNDRYTFSGTISGFAHAGKNITHTRTLTKTKGKPHWEIQDVVVNKPAGMHMIQLWHVPAAMERQVSIHATSENKDAIKVVSGIGRSSSLYGTYETTSESSFSTTGATINTVITLQS